MNELTPEKLFTVFQNFIVQAQTGSQETKKYKQNIAGLEIGAGFGKGQPARVPWFGFFAEGQTAQCGVYPVCLYYKKHDLFIVAYGVSQTKPPVVAWGSQIDDKISVSDELRKRSISSDYEIANNKDNIIYGNSFVKTCLERVSLISNINDDVFEEIYLNISEIIDEYKNIFGELKSILIKRVSLWAKKVNDINHKAIGSLAYLKKHGISISKELWEHVVGEIAKPSDVQGTAWAYARKIEDPRGGIINYIDGFVEFTPDIFDFACSQHWQLTEDEKKRILELAGVQEKNSGYVPAPENVMPTVPITISPETPRDQPAVAELFFSPYVEPDFLTIQSSIRKSGLILDERTLRRYHLSLKNRKFVILAGVSGTGKTWLAEEYAKAVSAEYLNVPVAPNWTSNEDLLGFHNPVLNSYQPTDFTAFLEKACAAQRQADVHAITSRPFHLILDEMNLARIEHYFARFLAAMELRQRQAAPILFLGPNKELFLPANLHFIGTVNVDETTHGFADKVFDRAQLIELPLSRELIAAHMEGKEYAVPLIAFWDTLHDVAPFAFRVLDDIDAYVEAAKALGAPWGEALDEMLVQKILPKIRGNDSRLAKVFDDLDAIAAEYDLSFVAEKIAYMRTSYHEHGFTSFFR